MDSEVASEVAHLDLLRGIRQALEAHISCGPEITIKIANGNVFVPQAEGPYTEQHTFYHDGGEKWRVSLDNLEGFVLACAERSHDEAYAIHEQLYPHGQPFFHRRLREPIRIAYEQPPVIENHPDQLYLF